MPIPPPARYVRSNLTAEQKQGQLAACYGVDMPVELSREEVERMRQIVQQHDAARKPMQTIDLNNPPKENYRYQKFPKMVYDLQKSEPGHLVTLIVNSETQLADAIDNGYSDEAPAFGEMPAEHLSAQYQNEANRVQEQLEQTRKRKTGIAQAAASLKTA
jgi:hypothetical protein